jgi:Sulfotransferase family
MAFVSESVKQRLRPYYRKLRSSLIVDRNGDWRKSIFVSSGARTGSTWVSQLINFDNRYRYMYEPFISMPLGYPEILTALPDNRILYLRPNDDNAKYVAQAEHIISGRFHHPRTDMYNTRIFVDKRLVKEVQSNLWLKWLKVHFPSMPVILLLRHPVPTIRSRYAEYFDLPVERRGEIDNDVAARHAHYRELVFGQPDLVADHLEPLRPALEAAETVAEQRAVVWCIQNYVPLRQFSRGEILLTFYENFCVDPENEIRRVASHLGDRIDDESLGRFLDRLRRPSANSKLKAEMLDGWKMVSSWQKKAPAEDVAQTKAVLKIFGLDKIYDASEPLPDVGAANAFL